MLITAHIVVYLHLVSLPDGAIIGLSLFGVIIILAIVVVMLATIIRKCSTKSNKVKKNPE